MDHKISIAIIADRYHECVSRAISLQLEIRKPCRIRNFLIIIVHFLMQFPDYHSHIHVATCSVLRSCAEKLIGTAKKVESTLKCPDTNCNEDLSDDAWLMSLKVTLCVNGHWRTLSNSPRITTKNSER